MRGDSAKTQRNPKSIPVLSSQPFIHKCLQEQMIFAMRVVQICICSCVWRTECQAHGSEPHPARPWRLESHLDACYPTLPCHCGSIVVSLIASDGLFQWHSIRFRLTEVFHPPSFFGIRCLGKLGLRLGKLGVLRERE